MNENIETEAETGAAEAQRLTTDAEQGPREYRIHVARMDAMRARLDELNAKGFKLGCPPAVLSELYCTEVPIYATDWEGRELFPREQIGVNRYVHCTVEGASPKFAGWSLAAVIEHAEAGNLLRKSPDCKVELNPRFRTCGPECEHCNTRRNRKDTYVVIHEDGTQKLVGRDCIRDFLGHDSPENILARMSWGLSLGAAFGDFEGEYCEAGSAPRPMYYVDSYLAFCACAIRHLGYISGSRAFNSYGAVESTASTAALWIDPPRGLSSKAREALHKPEDIDNQRAANARQYVLDTLGARTDLSDFENNLLVACRSTVVEKRNAGMLAFVVEYHARETEKSLARARENAGKVNEYFPAEPKARVKGVKITYLRSVGYESQFGPGFFHFFRSEGGHTLKWSTGTEIDDALPGKVYEATFTVKAHSMWKDQKQTDISRAKLNAQ